MRKLLIIFSAIAALFVFCFMAYLGIRHKSTSSDLQEAQKAYSQKNYPLAQRLSLRVIANDSANEDAYLILAQASFFRKSYLNSYYYWRMLSKLNPLNSDYTQRLCNAAILTQNDSLILSAYNGRKSSSSNIPEPLSFNAAMAYERSGDKQKSLEILNALKNVKSPYADIFLGNIALRRGNVKEAFEHFEKTKTSKNPHILAHSQYGLSLCAYRNSDLETAHSFVDKIDFSVVPELESNSKLLRANLYKSQRDSVRAIESYLEYLQIVPMNISAIAECAELAFSIGDEKTLQQLLLNYKISDKTSAFLEYYIKSLNFALSKDFVKSSECMNLSGVFSKRVPAILLSIKLGCVLNRPEQTIKALESLPQMPSKIQDILARDIRALLAQNLNDTKIVEKLSYYLLKLNPSDVVARKVVMHTNMSKSDFKSALSDSEKILEKSPIDRQAIETKLAALMALKEYEQGYNYAQKLIKSDTLKSVVSPFSVAFAIKLNDASKIESHIFDSYKSLMNRPKAVFEASEILLKAKKEKQVSDLVGLMNSSESPNKKVCVALVTSLQAQMRGYLKLAVKILADALVSDSENELLLTQLGSLQFQQNNIDAAESQIQKAYNKNPNSAQLRQMYALLLIAKNSNLEKASELLKSVVSDKLADSNTYLCLAQISSMSGDLSASSKYANSALLVDSGNEFVVLRAVDFLVANKMYEASINALLRLKRVDTHQELVEKLLLEYAKNPMSQQELKFIAERVLIFLPNSSVAKKIKSSANETLNK